jgi:hypothetical protein
MCAADMGGGLAAVISMGEAIIGAPTMLDMTGAPIGMGGEAATWPEAAMETARETAAALTGPPEEAEVAEERVEYLGRRERRSSNDISSGGWIILLVDVEIAIMAGFFSPLEPESSP